MPAKRTRLPVDERRAQLLAVANDILTTKPWDDISVEEIATAAGVSKANFYHYFPTKRNLYVELVRSGGEELMAASEPVMALPASDRLRGSLLAYLAYVETHAASYGTFLRAGIGSDDTVWQIVEGQRNRVIQRVADGLSLSQLRPVLRLALRGWVGYIEALSLAWLDNPATDREGILQLMERNLEASIASALALDPASLTARP